MWHYLVSQFGGCWHMLGKWLLYPQSHKICIPLLVGKNSLCLLWLLPYCCSHPEFAWKWLLAIVYRQTWKTTVNHGNLPETKAVARKFLVQSFSIVISFSESQQPPGTSANQSANTHFSIATGHYDTSEMANKSQAKCAWHQHPVPPKCQRVYIL